MATRTFSKDGMTYRLIRDTKKTDDKGREWVRGEFTDDKGKTREIRFLEVKGREVTEKDLKEAGEGIMKDPEAKDNDNRYTKEFSNL